MLSLMQAMLALARFYRNSPYSEPVRAKFDFVITRLFSRPVSGERRKPLFSRDEALGHLNALYREWSSVQLYSAQDDLSNITLTAMSSAAAGRGTRTAPVYPFPPEANPPSRR